MPLDVQDHPKEMVLFDAFKWPDDIPTDIPFEDLTPAQQQRIMDAYRFSGYFPGIYQGITGINDMP